MLGGERCSFCTIRTCPGILARNPDPRAHEQPQPSLYKQVKEADGTTTKPMLSYHATSRPLPVSCSMKSM